MSQPKTEPELARASPTAPPKTDRPLTVRSFGLSDPGRVRSTNEDRFVVVELARTLSVHHTNVPQSQAQSSSHRGHLLMVADGMGGHEAREVDSTMSVMKVEGFQWNTL